MTNIFIFKLKKIATKEELIKQVLELFEEMMNSKCSKLLTQERERLESDDEYYQSWCLSLPDWCPSVAKYVCVKLDCANAKI